jgi:hypothetical protein
VEKFESSEGTAGIVHNPASRPGSFTSKWLGVKKRPANGRLSNSIQTTGSGRHRLCDQETPKRRFCQEAVMSNVMSDADLFRQYAREAMDASEATSANEKRTLIELACTWAQAALMSERVWGSSYTPSPPDVGEAA